MSLCDFLTKKDEMMPGFYAPNPDKKMLKHQSYQTAEQASADGFVYRKWQKNRRIEKFEGVGLCACLDFVYDKVDRKASNERDGPKNHV